MSRVVPGMIGQLVCVFRGVEILSEDEEKEDFLHLLALDRAAGKLGTLIPPSKWRAHVFPMTYTACFEEAVAPQEEKLEQFRQELTDALFDLEDIQWDSVPLA